ncbi:MAG: PIN domain-containing protein [Peptococcaceae bacterium]|nr:MAG: PIN domain-containing protein [Peptococcaceae bacterium]
MGVAGFLEAVGKQGAVLIDTNVVIYFLEDSPVFGKASAELFHLIQRGKISGCLSVITAAELLVKPIRAGLEELAENIKFFLDCFPNLQLLEVTKDIALLAARVRASTNLKVPDAILVATATLHGCALVGNDSACSKKELGIPYIYLAGYLKEE